MLVNICKKDDHYMAYKSIDIVYLIELCHTLLLDSKIF
jgi:hypothetical protein